MGKLTITDTLDSAIVKLAEGNPGACKVLCEIVEKGDAIDPESLLGYVTVLYRLDDMRIYGSRIWMLYKDVCNQELVAMLAVLRAAQLGIITSETVTSAIDSDNFGTLDAHAVLGQVQATLPDFGKAA